MSLGDFKSMKKCRLMIFAADSIQTLENGASRPTMFGLSLNKERWIQTPEILRFFPRSKEKNRAECQPHRFEVRGLKVKISRGASAPKPSRFQTLETSRFFATHLRIPTLEVVSKTWTPDIPWLIANVTHVHTSIRHPLQRASTHASLPPLKDTVNSPT